MNVLFTEYCTTVTCSFTIDNVVDSATYEGITLAITGNENLASWEKEKLVTFESCFDRFFGSEIWMIIFLCEYFLDVMTGL